MARGGSARGGPSAPKVGDVLLYPYLWGRQHKDGETEGRKDRPTAVALRIARSTTATGQTGEEEGQAPAQTRAAPQTLLVLLAISSQPPQADQHAIEVPQTELRRASLDPSRRAWVYVSEYNTDILEASFYLDPSAEPIGRLSRTFVGQIAAALAETIRAKKGRVDRTV